MTSYLRRGDHYSSLDDSEFDIPDLTVSELSRVVPYLAKMLAEALRADRCAVFVYSEDQSSTIALVRYGYRGPDLEAHSWTDQLAPSSIPSERYLLETKQPLVRRGYADFVQYPLVNPGQETLEGRLTDLSVPLIWNEQVQGSACLWRKDDPTPFSESEIARAMALGQLTAMAVVFARQYESERIQRHRLDTLLEVASVASSGQGIDDVLQVLARAVRQATEADVCSLFIFDEQGDEVLSAYQDGLLPDELDIFEAEKTMSVSSVPAEMRMRRTPEPMIVRDVEADLAPDSPYAAYAERGISEILLIPIAWQSELIGIIYCWYREESRIFTQPAIELAEAIAQQVGGVVSRARLEAELQRQAAESEALLRIGQAVLESETFTPVLDEIARALRDLIPYDYASIGMLTEDRQGIRVVREWGVDFRPVIGTEIPVHASLSGTAVREARIVKTSQVRDDPRAWRNLPRRGTLQSVIVAPLSYDNNIFGTLFLARGYLRRFTAREEQLLWLLSQQAAVAIDRVRSREEMSRYAERQSLLANIGDLLVATDNPEHALQPIAKMLTGSIADGVVIGLAGWEFGSIRWVADAFIDPERAEILHRGLPNLDFEVLQRRLEDALIANREFSISPLLGEHRLLRAFAEHVGFKHALVLPLYQHERAPGLMILLSRNEALPFRGEDAELGRIIAQRIGDALERFQTKRNHEGLLRVSEALHGQSDIHELVRTIAAELERILPCDQLIIADIDPVQQMLHTQVYRKHGRETVGREFFPDTEGMCGEALRLRQPIMDNQADLRDSTVYGTRGERIFYRREGESALATPLIVEGEPVGVVFMNRAGHHRFTTTDFETFLLFAGLASAALDRTTLEHHNRELYRASTEVLAAVVDAKDPTTLEHSRHVAYYSRLLAELMELPEEMVDRIELSGLLHDIGKLGIPDRVLQKPGPLSGEELELIRTHPDRGARILQRHPALEDLVPMVRHHHEQYDGRGYPGGLEGNEIPIGARIICVADAFDTITSERTYQRRRSVDEALDELECMAGTQFHPELVKRFVHCLRSEPLLIHLPKDDE